MGPGQGVTSLCWLNNSSILASAAESGNKIVLSSFEPAAVTLVELAEQKGQTCVATNLSGSCIVSGGKDAAINIWDCKSKKLQKSFDDHKDAVTCVSYNENDSYVASGSLRGEILLHNTITNQSSAPLSYPKCQAVRDLQYSRFKKAIFGSVSDDGCMTLWDANARRPLRVFESAHRAPASALRFSPCNPLLVVSVGLDKRVTCYDAASKSLLQSKETDSPLTSLEIMPDGATLAVGSSRGRLILYDMRMMASPIKVASAHKTSVRCLRFHKSKDYGKSGEQENTKYSKQVKVASTYRSLRGSVSCSNLSSKHTSVPSSSTSTPVTSSTVSATSVTRPGAIGMTRSASAEHIDGKPVVKDTWSNDKGFEASPDERVKLAGGESTSHVQNVNAVSRCSLSDIFSPFRADLHNVSKSNIKPVQYPRGSISPYSSTDGFSASRPHALSQNANCDPQTFSPLTLNTQVLPKVVLHSLQVSNGMTRTEPCGSNSDSQKAEVVPDVCGPTITGPNRGQTPIGIPSASLHSSYSATASSLTTSNGSSIPVAVASTEQPNNGEEHHVISPQQIQIIRNLVEESVASLKASWHQPATDGQLSKTPAVQTSREGDAANPGHLLSPVPIQFVRGLIEDAMEHFMEIYHKDLVNLQLEMIRQFQIQEMVVETILERNSSNQQQLVAEIEKLKEENKRLRANY
uniref:NEDD1 gamma-tubulin ring complex targeting factor n=1 Tax=Eptatretus burgeri TaxID=7764 RepID=A0A8C4QKT8_EPTBU